MDTVIPVNDQQRAGKNAFTRLNGVKITCMETLKKMKEEEPLKRVSIYNVIATCTQVEAKLIVNHKYLYIRDEKIEAEEVNVRNNPDYEAAKQNLEALKQSMIIRNIGNANIDTEITFE
jgi:hypothetical protein